MCLVCGYAGVLRSVVALVVYGRIVENGEGAVRSELHG